MPWRSYPVIGELRPRLNVPSILQSAFGAFDTGTIHGLANVTDDTGTTGTTGTTSGPSVPIVPSDHRQLDLLAVAAHVPGQGDLRRFIRDCQHAYRGITVLEVMNPALAVILTRYGFLPFQRAMYNEMTSGFEWRENR